MTPFKMGLIIANCVVTLPDDDWQQYGRANASNTTLLIPFSHSKLSVLLGFYAAEEFYGSILKDRPVCSYAICVCIAHSLEL